MAVTAPNRLPSASPAPLAPTETPSDVVFEEDFSTYRNHWLSEVLPDSEKGYENGEFRMSVYQENWATWTHPHPPRDLTDYALEVDARRVSGPLDSEYGVLVHYQEATDEFYLFVISSDGFFEVQRHEGKQWHDLVKWTESAAIRGGEETNRLRVECHGSTMRFFANGELLAQVDDPTFGSGYIGLMGGAGKASGAVVAFDNLRVQALTAP